jgi:mono/diheme cytochrome c family protein
MTSTTFARIAAAGAAIGVAGWLGFEQGADPATSPATIALGDSVFHGRTGGALCYVCHGPTGKGMAGLGPSLIDKEWLHGDGSVAFIARIVTEGVPKPKKTAGPMPPKGGGNLSELQVSAVAAYVHSLSQPKK